MGEDSQWKHRPEEQMDTVYHAELDENAQTRNLADTTRIGLPQQIRHHLW